MKRQLRNCSYDNSVIYIGSPVDVFTWHYLEDTGSCSDGKQRNRHGIRTKVKRMERNKWPATSRETIW